MADSAGRRLPRANPSDVILVAVATGVVAIVGLAVAFAPRDQGSGSEALAATSVDEATLPQTVPFRYVAGHIIVDAVLDGSSEPVSFILDSGAPTVYSHSAAGLIGGDTVGTIPVRAIDGSVLEVDVVNVSSLRIGDALFHDVAGTKGFVEPDNPLSCLSEYGLIGANLLKSAVWQIDYGSREIIIASSVDGLDHIDHAVAFHFGARSRASPSPRLRFPTADGDLTFILDTGSDGGLTSNPADLEAVGVTVDPSGPRIDLIAAGGAGTFEASVIYAGVDLELGGISQANYPVGTTHTLGRGEGIIGNDFLDGFIVTIDWPGGKVYLDPVSSDGSILMPPDPLGANLSWDSEGLIIGSVVPGSTATDVGLELGEAVSSINGEDRSTNSRSESCTLQARGALESVSVTTMRGITYTFAPVVGFFDSLGG